MIDKSPNIVRTKTVAQPNLEEAHEEARLLFARNHIAWTHQWDNVNFTEYFSEYIVCFMHCFKENRMVQMATAYTGVTFTKSQNSSQSAIFVVVL